MKTPTKTTMKTAILKVMMVKTKARITSNKISLIIKRKKHRIILTKKISSHRIIINKMSRQSRRNQWMTRSSMSMEMIFSSRFRRELNKTFSSNKKKRKRKRVMKECLKKKMIRWKIFSSLKWWMINKWKIKMKIKMLMNLKHLNRNINLMMKKLTSSRVTWQLIMLKMQKCLIKKMKKINKTKMERIKNL